MFAWIKKLFCRKHVRTVDLLFICGSIKPTKPLKKRYKRDRNGRFVK